MSSIPTDERCVEYLEEAGCKRRVIVHCCTVNAVAQEIVSRVDGADRGLVTAGALLHDIGRSVDHSIMHAYIGSQIVAAYGLPQEIVDIVRKHTGAGLDEEDVREMSLPPADYMPRTLEEKIVAHADNMVSDNRVVDHMHSVNKLRNKGAYRGAARIEALHRELSGRYGEDLDVIPRRIGEMPDLELLRRMGLLRPRCFGRPAPPDASSLIVFPTITAPVSTMVTELNESDFDSFVESNRVVVVDCWAPWCGPCRRMGPIIEEAAGELEGRVAFAKLNTDDNQAIAVRFQINAIPTLLVFRDGVLVDTMVGLRPKEDIVSAVGGLRWSSTWRSWAPGPRAYRRPCTHRGRRRPP